MIAKPKKVILAFCTFKRQAYLVELLNSINNLFIPDGCELEILVVDNEVSHETYSIIRNFKTKHKIHYETCKKRGLVLARNHALTILRQKNPDYIGFVDDDETLNEEWLEDMVGYISYADILSGIIKIRENENISENLRQAYEFKAVQEVKMVKTTPMGNIFFTREVLNTGLNFDERFNFSGGEDIKFFRELYKRKFLIAKIPAAIVYETLVPEKATWKAFFKRQCRVAQIHYAQKSWLSCYALAFIDSLTLPFMLPLLFSGDKHYAKILKKIAKICGRLLARKAPKQAYGK